MGHESFMGKIVSDNMNAAIREIVRQEIAESLRGTIQEIADEVIQEEVPIAVDEALSSVVIDGGEIE